MLGALALGFGVPGTAAAPELVTLGKLQDGLWELRFRDGAPTKRLCLHDIWRLIQLQHPDLACNRLILEDRPTTASVQYTCRGKGFGRTTIFRESAELVQVETQGIAGGLPFELSLEGRRLGDCPASRPQAVASPGRGD